MSRFADRLVLVTAASGIGAATACAFASTARAAVPMGRLGRPGGVAAAIVDGGRTAGSGIPALTPGGR